MAKALKTNLWPYSIIGFFVIAILAITGWVSFAMRNSMDLVRSDYYEQDVLHQQQIDRVARTSAIREKPDFSYDPATQMLNLRLPLDHADQATTGTVNFYRPSDASLDRQVELDVAKNGSQSIDVQGFRGGYWKVNVAWTRDGQEYFFERPLVLSGEPGTPTMR